MLSHSLSQNTSLANARLANAYLGCKMMRKRKNAEMQKPLAKTQFFCNQDNRKMMQKQENTKVCLVCDVMGLKPMQKILSA